MRAHPAPQAEANGASDDSLEHVVDELLSAGPEAVRAAKQLVREHPNANAAAQIAARLRTSEEGQAGLRAFLDKKPAPWRSESS